MQAELKAKGQKELIAFRVPGLSAGLVARNGARGAGDAFPQALVRRNGTTGRFDDVAGRGFMIIARGMEPALSAEDRAFWQSLGGTVVRLGADAVEDADGGYTRLMDEYDCDVLIKRPDYYLFGACRHAELPAALADLRAQLTER
jgi:hypothetical protein